MAEFTDPRADLRWGTTSELVRDGATRWATVEAIVDGDERLTYRQLDELVDQVAASLLASGLQRGDRGCVWAPNSARWIIAALGLQRAGGVLVPLNTRFQPDEAAYVLAKADVRLLFTVNGFLGRDYLAGLRQGQRGDGAVVASLPALRQVVLLEGPAPMQAGVLSWSAFLADGLDLAAGEVAERANSIGLDDISDVLFTSGTTGRPKGAVCTHGQTLRAYAVWSEVVGLRAGDRYLVVNPFFHGFGYKAGWLASLLVGATVLPARTLDVPRVLEVVEAERVTVLPGTPTLYQTMLDHPDFTADGVGSLRLAVTGAANVPPPLLARVRNEIGFTDVVTGYGLTESSAIVSMCHHTDPIEVIATTAGRPLPGLQVQTVDAQGKATATGEPGEIWVRGYAVMREYLDEPEETAAAIDSEGWLHTGDIGVIDESGRIRITDRIKDMFIVGGFNAYPAEIESVLSRHPGISSSAVIGVPDERMGEVGMAWVVPRPGCELNPSDLTAWARQAMANYKVPRSWRVVDALPLNASGKVLKADLRAAAALP
jgi:acyl-CoA synthetase (AMP-forming)/AMP-acid ligase II